VRVLAHWGFNAHADVGVSIGPIVAFEAPVSMLRIQRTTDGTLTAMTVSGRLDAENINELRQSLDTFPDGEAVVLDLADLLLADREAVLFLGDREASGRIVLRHCPAYIRRWLESERTR
jgi:hypothetical protein